MKTRNTTLLVSTVFDTAAVLLFSAFVVYCVMKFQTDAPRPLPYVSMTREVVVDTKSGEILPPFEASLVNLGQSPAVNVFVSFNITDNPRLLNDSTYSDLGVYYFEHYYNGIAVGGEASMPDARKLQTLLGTVAARYGGTDSTPAVYLNLRYADLSGKTYTIREMIILKPERGANAEGLLEATVNASIVYD